MASQVKQRQHSAIASILFTSLLLGSCSAAVHETPQTSAPAGSPMNNTAISGSALDGMDSTASQSAKQLMNTAKLAQAVPAKPPIPQQKTQLIKTATLGLRVQNVEKMIQGATQVVMAHGGDILNLKDQIPQTNTAYHTATFTFRVPQSELDGTLADLAKLGTLETRSIQATDVATQLVDFESRLKNLRKTEEVVLGIMDRSGSIGDVLKVSQELSQIRNEIEQIQGQVQHLKQQVAFSTINLTLKAAIAKQGEEVGLGDRLQETWSQSTHALGETTTKLLRIGIWLLVFSPYLLGGVGLIFLGRKALLRRKATSQISTSEPQG